MQRYHTATYLLESRCAKLLGMKPWLWLGISVLLLVLGVGIIIAYWHGTATFGMAWPMESSGISMSGSATGLGAAVGLLFIVGGLIALLVSAVHAVIARFR